MYVIVAALKTWFFSYLFVDVCFFLPSSPAASSFGLDFVCFVYPNFNNLLVCVFFDIYRHMNAAHAWCFILHGWSTFFFLFFFFLVSNGLHSNGNNNNNSKSSKQTVLLLMLPSNWNHLHIIIQCITLNIRMSLVFKQLNRGQIVRNGVEKIP